MHRGAWVDIGSSNGPGWKPVGGRGVVTLWGSTDGAPVRVGFGGRTVDAHVSGNHCFFVEWDVAEPSGREWPRVVFLAWTELHGCSVAVRQQPGSVRAGQSCRYGVVVASSVKPRRSRIGRLSAVASTCR